MIFNSPVYPIPPSFINDELDLESIKKYIKFIEDNGGNHIMTTAGTSQFNLLSIDEVRILNSSLINNFNNNVIIGIPPLSLKHTLEEIYYYNKQKSDNKTSNVYLLILFPERYYNNEQVINFFTEVCEKSEYPILAHGNPLKKGNGGVYEYDYELLKKLSEIDGFVGIKEESSTIDYSIKNIGNLNLEIIVAGGSMYRFWCLEPFGATTYLSGVGSFNPKMEEDFYKNYIDNNKEYAKNIMLNYEKPLFKKFMNIGWHASMRESLRIMGYINNNREPFYTVTEEEKNIIKKALNKIL